MRTSSRCCGTAASGSSLPSRSLGVSAQSCEVGRRGSCRRLCGSRGGHTAQRRHGAGGEVLVQLQGQVWEVTLSIPLPPSAPFLLCGGSEQDSRYFPANFATLKVIWRPDLTLKQKDFSGRRAFLA